MFLPKLPPDMVRSPISLNRTFSYPFFFRLFPLPEFRAQISLHHTTHKSPKLFPGYWNKLRFACLSNTAALPVLDEFAVEGDEASWPNPNGDGFLHLLEERGIRANYQTFVWLLQGYMNVGASRDGKKLHGKIIKTGLDGEGALCDKLLEFYLSANDLGSAVKVFDDMPSRNVFSWNKVISRFTEKKSGGVAVGLFSRMIAENTSPNEGTYAAILRTCSAGTVAFDYEQIHSRIIHHGFSSNNLVCNRLIDLYCKNGCTVSARKVFDRLYEKDKVSWVAMISGLSQNGLEQQAILLFCEMHESGIFPTPYVFSSVISACTKRELYRLGEQLHALVIKQGFSSEIYVCNALVTLYSRSGSFKYAEQIFSKMQERDGVTYNSLISGLAQCGFSSRALDLFEKMQRDCLKPDCVTVASLLGACASTEALDAGKQLHSYAIKAGFLEDIIVEGSLLDLYVKCSDIKNAHEFFCATKTENVVLWNVMLVLFGKLGDFSRSFEIFREMHLEGLIPNQYTYPSVLRTCILVKALDLGEQIHTQVIKTGFQHNMYVCSVLIDMYAKLGQLDTAYEILRRVDEADVVSWTAMIAGFTQHDMFDKALELYGDMLRQGIQSDNIGFSSAISACAGIRALHQGKQIHGQTYVCGFSDDLSIRNALVSLYSRCGQMQQAYLAFEKIKEKNNISWNALVSGFAQSGHCEEALQVLAQMHRAGLEADLFTFGAAVSAAANIANVKQGKQVHAMVLKTGYDSEVEVCNSLITLYAKCGCIDDAKNQFLEMPEKNEISWNAMITGYSQHGCGTKAIDLFESMKEFGIAPNHVTFIGVLSACSHVGLVNEGLSYFGSMSKEHGVEPKPEHYVCIVDLLGRAGLLDQARRFVEDMPIEPDAMIWRTLLSACVVHKNLEIGELAAHRLLELEPKDSASYALRSNLYAVSGEWTSRDQTRQMMKERGVKKEPGRSWIEFQNTIHAFFVGDQLHPLTDKIYKYLEDLNREAAKIGYVQESYSLFNGMEQMQKDPTMYVHSEKLAITFGLLNLSSQIPVRVMKNLRVCNDCHNWIKFVSKISNRVIVVRDAYRFHHFEGGSCSCKDYW